jgi:hypothetical protein
LGECFSLCNLIDRYIIYSPCCCSKPVKIFLPLCCVCKGYIQQAKWFGEHVAEVWERLLVHCNPNSNLFTLRSYLQLVVVVAWTAFLVKLIPRC